MATVVADENRGGMNGSKIEVLPIHPLGKISYAIFNS